MEIDRQKMREAVRALNAALDTFANKVRSSKLDEEFLSRADSKEYVTGKLMDTLDLIGSQPERPWATDLFETAAGVTTILWPDDGEKYLN